MPKEPRAGGRPDVSIILCTRGRHDLLPRALASALGQTHRSLEVVVVDDNDPDSRAAAQPELQELLADPRLTFVENDGPHGAGRARNLGLAAARGEWVCYLDDDDVFLPRKVEAQLGCLRRTGAPFCLCGVRFRMAGGRSREVQADVDQYAGDDRFLRAQIITGAFFHLRSLGLRHSETLPSSIDLYFYLQLVRELALDPVPNVPEVLYEVPPGRHPRVSTGNTRAEAWAAIERDFGACLPPRVLSVMRSRRRFWCAIDGGWPEFVRASGDLLVKGGPGEWRSLLNGAGRKCGLGRFMRT